MHFIDSVKVYTLIAIVFFYPFACVDPILPSVFAQLSYVIDWMRSYIGNLNEIHPLAYWGKRMLYMEKHFSNLSEISRKEIPQMKKVFKMCTDFKNITHHSATLWYQITTYNELYSNIFKHSQYGVRMIETSCSKHILWEMIDYRRWQVSWPYEIIVSDQQKQNTKWRYFFVLLPITMPDIKEEFNCKQHSNIL